MNKKRFLSFASRPLGIGILIVTALGILSSLASFIFLVDKQFTTGYIITHSINFVGDIITLIGSVLLIVRMRLGRVITQIGSAVFGVAGFTFLSQSIIGGVVTIVFAFVFFVLARNVRIEASDS